MQFGSTRIPLDGSRLVTFRPVNAADEPFLIRVYGSTRLDELALTEYQQRGIGGSLLQALLEEARTTGKSVTLHVDKFNRAARLYERLGFSVTEDTGGSFKMEWQTEGNQTTETE